jgi:hypothetical protein
MDLMEKEFENNSEKNIIDQTFVKDLMLWIGLIQ